MRIQLFVFLMAFAILQSCSKSNTDEKVVPNLEPIVVAMDNFEPSDTNLSSWIFPFTTTPDGNGSMDRVFCYASEKEFEEDTKKMMATMYGINGSKYVVKEMLARIKKVVDFTNNDVIVARITPLEPKDSLVYYLQNDTIQFCLENGTKNQLLDPKVYWFKAPKNSKVKYYIPEITQKTWKLSQVFQGDKEEKNIIPVSLNWLPNAKYEVTLPCGKFTGRYTRNEREIACKAFSPKTTKCDSIASSFLSNLLEVNKYSYTDKGELVLHLNYNARRLIFR